jgi:hypothetical protein
MCHVIVFDARFRHCNLKQEIGESRTEPMRGHEEVSPSKPAVALRLAAVAMEPSYMEAG